MKKQQEIVEDLSQDFNRTVSSKDSMYICGQDAHYFSVGHSAIKCINAGLSAANMSSPKNILDMACGYGRVLRMLKAFFPAAQLTACDIDAEAVDFCAETFGANKVYSDINFEAIVLEERFDLIWCGSLLTHLDISHWEPFIRFCTEHLTKNGLLIFTTHGQYVARMIKDYDFYYGLKESQAHKLVNDYEECGFGYCQYPSQSSYYGFSITSPPQIVSFMEKQSKLQLCSLIEMGWDDHQDVYSYCYKQDFVLEEIDAYVKRLVDDISLMLIKTNLKFESYSSLKEKTAEWIETKAKEDNMSVGPRLHHILVKLVLEQITEKLDIPCSE